MFYVPVSSFLDLDFSDLHLFRFSVYRFMNVLQMYDSPASSLVKFFVS